MLSIFSCACWPFVYLLGRMSIQVLCPFFNQVVCFLMLCCMNSLYIWGINPLPDVVCKCLLLFIGCLFVLLIVSFTVQRLFFSLMYCSSICLFCFCFPCLRRQIQKKLLRPRSESVLPMFSSRSFWFQVLHLTL